jgi:hypothetical protein
MGPCGGQCFIFGALYPSKSGLIHKHIVIFASDGIEEREREAERDGGRERERGREKRETCEDNFKEIA